jgi:hypothetical protein
MAKKTVDNGNKDYQIKLHVPIDASSIEEIKGGQTVQVVTRDAGGILQSEIVRLDEKGKGTAVFSFEKIPGALTIALGPENVSKDEIFGLQTINLTVSARQWKNLNELHLPLVIISPFYWHWWLRWCRTFTIRGRVVCKDGGPVPGARVCAYDVDWFWWWRSKDQVGCAVTDVNGAFEIKFRWCCGWWPWWWWRIRRWELDPDVLNHIRLKYYEVGPYPPIPLPDPEPGLAIFKHFLGEQEFASLNIKTGTVTVEGMNEMKSGITNVSPTITIDPAILDTLRGKILKRFPVPNNLQRLKIWPWWPWYPWSDCTPDIIFRVTQNCNGANHVIVDENIFDTRWDIPTNLNVTLHANDDACCIASHDDDPDGTCALLMNACWDPVNQIGGNPGALPVPVGYANPGVVNNNGDRPYAENVFIQGKIGSNVDYYAFEFSSDNGVVWNDIPNSAIGDFSRQYWEPGPNIFTNIAFLKFIDGKTVFETRQHFEDTHDPTTWGTSRYWMVNNYFGLMNWLTRTPFLNGNYQLRVKGWKLVAGHLVNQEILNTCSTIQIALLKLHIDNRTVFSPPPVTPPVCGQGTVHICTLEPDCDFISLKIIHYDPIEGVKIVEDLSACGVTKPITQNDEVQIDFRAHDPRGHLEDYSLHANYRENLTVDILALLPPGSTPMVLSGGPSGPDYKTALSHGAISPNWYGGDFRITLPAKSVFPETCCYQLELFVKKRNIVNCDYSYWGYYNHCQYQITVNVV